MKIPAQSPVNLSLPPSAFAQIPTKGKGSRPRNLDYDFTKLRRIITKHKLVNGTSYLCEWTNRKPTWVRSEKIPRTFIDNYNQRMANRATLRWLKQGM